MESFCVRSIRGFAKFSRDPYYEPTTVVHDITCAHDSNTIMRFYLTNMCLSASTDTKTGRIDWNKGNNVFVFALAFPS